MIEQHAGFVAYEYQEHTVEKRYASYYKDGYGYFGWQVETQQPHGVELQGRETLRLKRDRHIPNRMELTRLQRQFEAIMEDVRRLEHSVQNQATIAGLGCGLAGTVFMGGSTFAITAAAPIVWLCAVLAVPGFILWGAAYPLYRYVQKQRAQEVLPLVEGKLDEMYEVCEKASRLLEA
ncbi:MAG: hypothetical protein SOY30_01270 [Eubacteriales bacterium]|nr:hypothetical protein [Eubacteriales bacterium]